MRHAAPLVVASIALLTGAIGWRLDPDTALYSRRGLHLWPSPLGDLSGTIGGHRLVVVVSAIAAAIAIALVPERGRLLFAGAATWAFAFPGVDALGIVFVLLALRASSRAARAGAFTLAALAHPVAAIVTAPLMLRDDELADAIAALLTTAIIVVVGLADTWSTTDRYALPLFAALLLTHHKRSQQCDDVITAGLRSRFSRSPSYASCSGTGC